MYGIAWLRDRVRVRVRGKNPNPQTPNPSFSGKEAPAGALSRAHRGFLCLQTRHLLCLQTRHLLCQQTRHLLCQHTRHLWFPKTSLLHCPHRGGRKAAAPVLPMPKGRLGRPQMSCLLTRQMSCLLTQQMSCLQTHQMSCLQIQDTSVRPRQRSRKGFVLRTGHRSSQDTAPRWAFPLEQGWTSGLWHPPRGVSDSGPHFPRTCCKLRTLHGSGAGEGALLRSFGSARNDAWLSLHTLGSPRLRSG